MRVGYMRVSTTDQNEALQHDALLAAGCEKLYSDTITGATFDRPGLDAALAFLRSGDTLVVWKLDRLGRSLQHLIETVNALAQRGCEFASLTESIDTTTPGGKLIFHIMGALAEFERDLIRQRTHAGLEAARARGHLGGRRNKLSKKQAALAVSLYTAKQTPIDTICTTMGISRSTLHRYVRRHAQNGAQVQVPTL